MTMLCSPHQPRLTHNPHESTETLAVSPGRPASFHPGPLLLLFLLPVTLFLQPLLDVTFP